LTGSGGFGAHEKRVKQKSLGREKVLHYASEVWEKGNIKFGRTAFSGGSRYARSPLYTLTLSMELGGGGGGPKKQMWVWWFQIDKWGELFHTEGMKDGNHFLMLPERMGQTGRRIERETTLCSLIRRFLWVKVRKSFQIG